MLATAGHDYDVSGVFATRPREAPGAGGLTYSTVLPLLCTLRAHDRAVALTGTEYKQFIKQAEALAA